MNYEVYEAQTFWDCVLSLQRDDAVNRAALMESLIELRRKPFHNPVLQTHDVGVGLNGKKVFSSDVGGRRGDRRVVWQVFDRTVVLLLYGTHAVQDRAKRMRVSYDEADKRVTVLEQAPDSGAERPYPQQRAEIGRLFMYVADIKYTLTADAVARNADHYQLLAYTTALDLPEGVLIYCLADGGVPERSVTVRHAGKVLHTYAIDLTGPPASVDAAISALADWLVERSRSRPLAAAV